MDTNTTGWICLICALLITTFGIFWLCTILVATIAFLLSFISLLYLKQGDVEQFLNKFTTNPLTTPQLTEGGLRCMVTRLTTPKEPAKSDRRVTGSELIDSSLQEILGYIIRDYIHPWYNLISRDQQFIESSLRKTAQEFAINISNRVKEIDWIPFLTTRLVDDAASHLRLFKQARAKMKQHDSRSRTTRNSPMRERNSPKRTVHKRNKSETDVSWFVGKGGDLKRDVGNSKFYGGNEGGKISLEENFFDLECEMERNLVCRDGICCNVQNEKEFLSEVLEVLLYMLLPDEDFQCKPLRFLIREIFANCVVLPLINMLSDPDYINQAIIWLCLRDVQLPTDIFITTLRLSDNCDELKSTKELAMKEIQQLRSRDSGGDSDLSIKQQLSSLAYVTKLIDNRLMKIGSTESGHQLDELQLEKIKQIQLNLDQILKNNVALSYFIDFVASQDKQLDLFFYLNIEGWKTSVEQQLAELALNKLKTPTIDGSAVHDTIRSTALSIYEQYLGDKSEGRVQIKAAIVQKVYFKIRNLSDPPTELWFDEVQAILFNRMQSEVGYLPSFKQSKAYIKLLHELELVPQSAAEEDALSVESLEAETPSMGKNNNFLRVEAEKNVKHARSFSDVTLLTAKEPFEEIATAANNDTADDYLIVDEKVLKTGQYSLGVNIIETGIVSEKGKTFGIYAIRVSRQYETGFLEEWHIYRRYSDFHDLYTKVKEKFPVLSKLAFPGKKTFHNMDRSVLERRMKMLGSYMHELCHSPMINTHASLRDLLMTFLEQGEYDKQTGGPISSTINTLVNPLRSGMKTIKNMPEQLINTVDEVVEGLSKVFHSKPGRVPEASKVGAAIEETDDNIPLRIMLLLMDEVFDLKSRNQWLRRRIVTLLRQIVRTVFGDIVNRRILDYVSFITSPKNVYHYLHVFKQSFWPNGARCEKKLQRDSDTIYRTRVAAKVALLSCLSDELKHIIGSETTRRGLLTIFELFQKPTLNRRLLYVLFEGVICTMFPEKDMLKLFQKLHAKSKRIQSQKDAR